MPPLESTFPLHTLPFTPQELELVAIGPYSVHIEHAAAQAAVVSVAVGYVADDFERLT